MPRPHLVHPIQEYSRRYARAFINTRPGSHTPGGHLPGSSVLHRRDRNDHQSRRTRRPIQLTSDPIVNLSGGEYGTHAHLIEAHRNPYSENNLPSINHPRRYRSLVVPQVTWEVLSCIYCHLSAIGGAWSIVLTMLGCIPSGVV